MHIALAMAWYLDTEVLASSCRSSRTRLTTLLSVLASRVGTVFLVRSTMVVSSSSSCSHFKSWLRELGLSKPVSRSASASVRWRTIASHSMAAWTSLRSSFTPLVIMRWSRCHSFHSDSGTGNLANLSAMACSLSTSAAQ